MIYKCNIWLQLSALLEEKKTQAKTIAELKLEVETLKEQLKDKDECKNMEKQDQGNVVSAVLFEKCYILEKNAAAQENFFKHELFKRSQILEGAQNRIMTLSNEIAGWYKSFGTLKSENMALRNYLSISLPPL